MSAGARVTLEQADRIVAALFARWELSTYSCAVVGSVRRRKPDIGEIDILAPRCSEGIDVIYDSIARSLKSQDLFASLNNSPIGVAVRGFKKHFGECTLQLSMLDSVQRRAVDIQVQVVRYEPGDRGNRGWKELMRTGPDDFGQWFLGRWKYRMGIAIGFGDDGGRASIDGFLVDKYGKPVPTATEADCFRIANLPFITPENRTYYVNQLAKPLR